MSADSGGLLGRLAVHYKLINMNQLAEAVAQQSHEPHRRLGEILIERQLITEQQLQKLLKVQKQYLEKTRQKKQEQPRAKSIEEVKPPPSSPGVASVNFQAGAGTGVAASHQADGDATAAAFRAAAQRPAATAPREEGMNLDEGGPALDLADGPPSASRPNPAAGDGSGLAAYDPSMRMLEAESIATGNEGPTPEFGSPGDTYQGGATGLSAAGLPGAPGRQEEKVGLAAAFVSPPPEAAPAPGAGSAAQSALSAAQPGAPAQSAAFVAQPAAPVMQPAAPVAQAAAPVAQPAAPAAQPAAPVAQPAAAVAQPAAPVAQPAAAVAQPAAPAQPAPAPAVAPTTAPDPVAPTPAQSRPPADPRAVQWLNGVLGQAAETKASDIHVHAGATIKLRRFTRLIEFTERPLPPPQAEAVLTAILDDWQYNRLMEAGEVDLAYSVPGVGRFRANVYRQHRGLNGVFHYIPPVPPSLDDLGLPHALAKVTNFHQGLVLVTGPAGCGKSSTLAALVNIINEERTDHILTIEDPIEYIHPSKRCVVNQRQVVRHTESFARALRAALREDPDVICIGELRDLETISLALSAAETGHLVIGTLHTNSAIRTINRLIGVYPPGQQSQIRTMLSESLRAVIAQRLLPCSEGDDVVLALEILYGTKAVGNLIRENRTFQLHSILQTGVGQGMCLLDISLHKLLKEGRITKETAAAASDNPKQFR